MDALSVTLLTLFVSILGLLIYLTARTKILEYRLLLLERWLRKNYRRIKKIESFLRQYGYVNNNSSKK